MAPKYTLHYLKVPARGALARIIFHHAGVEFVDKKYSFSQVPEIKADNVLFPMGQVPTLEVDGEVIAESHSIIRYLAREFNLYGSTNKDKVIIDQVLDVMKNVEENCWKFFFWHEGEEQANGIKNTFENIVPKSFKYIERLLKSNKDGKGFLVGDSMTIADMEVMLTIETMMLHYNTSYRDFLDGYPLLKALNDRVRESPKIKNYLEKRGPPVYDFSELKK